MKLTSLLIMMALAISAFAQPDARVVETGNGHWLEVDGKPFIVVGGETGNSMASSRGDVALCMDKAVKSGYNTVLMPVAWELIEPQLGRFDFESVDVILDEARKHDLKVGILWFGAWKNSMSCYAPEWFKKDTKRYPRACTEEGKPLEIASAFNKNVLEADMDAFTHLVEYLAQNDKDGNVIMIQVENEIGMLESARDHSAEAEKEYQKGVPEELIKFLKQQKKYLHPRLYAKWEEKGFKEKGTWGEVFGDDKYTDELFMAWNYGKYVEKLTAKGRATLGSLPFYANCALDSRGRTPGQYPSAGPLAHLKDIWHAAAPSLSYLSPDIYDKGFRDWTTQYALEDNPLFIPEIKTAHSNPSQLLYVLGHHDALGMCPFAYNLRNDRDLGHQRKGNEVAKWLTSLLKGEKRAKFKDGFYFDESSKSTDIEDGDVCIKVSHYFTLPWDPRATDGSVWPETGGLVIRLNPYEYLIAGSGFVAKFEPKDAIKGAEGKLGEDGFMLEGAAEKSSGQSKWNGSLIGLAQVESVKVNPDGSLTRVRTYNGDETHQGRHVRVGVDDFEILHVRLYRYS